MVNETPQEKAKTRRRRSRLGPVVTSKFLRSVFGTLVAVAMVLLSVATSTVPGSEARLSVKLTPTTPLPPTVGQREGPDDGRGVGRGVPVGGVDTVGASVGRPLGLSDGGREAIVVGTTVGVGVLGACENEGADEGSNDGWEGCGVGAGAGSAEGVRVGD